MNTTRLDDRAAVKGSQALNVLGSSALLSSNILVCAALSALRHSADNAGTRTFYLLAANGLAGLLGFLPLRSENALRIDRPAMAVALWSACYCAEYGLFLVYPGAISLSQLIVCNSLAPFLAVYLSRDVQRSALTVGYRLLSFAPVFFLLGISWLERRVSERERAVYADLILLCHISIRSGFAILCPIRGATAIAELDPAEIDHS